MVLSRVWDIEQTLCKNAGRIPTDEKKKDRSTKKNNTHYTRLVLVGLPLAGSFIIQHVTGVFIAVGVNFCGAGWICCGSAGRRRRC